MNEYFWIRSEIVEIIYITFFKYLELKSSLVLINFYFIFWNVTKILFYKLNVFLFFVKVAQIFIIFEYYLIMRDSRKIQWIFLYTFLSFKIIKRSKVVSFTKVNFIKSFVFKYGGKVEWIGDSLSNMSKIMNSPW